MQILTKELHYQAENEDNSITKGCIFKATINLSMMYLYITQIAMFIFLDETGADRRNSLRKYGYSIRGKRPINH